MLVCKAVHDADTGIFFDKRERESTLPSPMTFFLAELWKKRKHFFIHFMTESI